MCVCVCVCVPVALVIQHSKRMSRIILRPVSCLAAIIFPHYLTNGTLLRKNVIEQKIPFSFSPCFWLKRFYSKKNSTRFYYKHTYVFVSSAHYYFQILKKLEFSRRSSEKTQMSNFMKIRPMGAELLHVDGQTHRQQTDRQTR